MRGKVTLMAVALMLVSAPTMADMVLTDDFDGGFDLGWVWTNGGGDARAAISGDELRLYSPGGYYDSFVGGFIPSTYSLEAYVTAKVNTGGMATGNDQGIVARLQPTGGNEFYGLNYDPFLSKLQLIYNNGAAFVNLAGQGIGSGGYGQIGQEVELRLQVINFGQVVRLVGQAWDPTGTILLANVQEIIDGTTEIGGVVVPVLGAGLSGVYAALNENEYIETGGLSPLNTSMDDFLAKGDCSDGDANLDGVVDELDYAILAANWGVGDSWAEGDFNFDGIVDDEDLEVISENWGGAGVAPTTIPEPTTLCLLGVGAVAAYFRRKS